MPEFTQEELREIQIAIRHQIAEAERFAFLRESDREYVKRLAMLKHIDSKILNSI